VTPLLASFGLTEQELLSEATVRGTQYSSGSVLPTSDCAVHNIFCVAKLMCSVCQWMMFQIITLCQCMSSMVTSLMLLRHQVLDGWSVCWCHQYSGHWGWHSEKATWQTYWTWTYWTWTSLHTADTPSELNLLVEQSSETRNRFRCRCSPTHHVQSVALCLDSPVMVWQCCRMYLKQGKTPFCYRANTEMLR